jgi:transposase
MRKSFDGLLGLISESLSSTPVSGDVFIFVNRRRDKIKLLHWQGAGFTLYYKRLEEDGTFEVPSYLAENMPVCWANCWANKKRLQPIKAVTYSFSVSG